MKSSGPRPTPSSSIDFTYVQIGAAVTDRGDDGAARRGNGTCPTGGTDAEAPGSSGGSSGWGSGNSGGEEGGTDGFIDAFTDGFIVVAACACCQFKECNDGSCGVTTCISKHFSFGIAAITLFSNALPVCNPSVSADKSIRVISPSPLDFTCGNHSSEE
jgi:hypothetical protein